MGVIMKEFTIPVVDMKIQGKLSSVIEDNDVEGIELEYLWDSNKPRVLFSGVIPVAGKDGLGFSFCVEAPHNKLKANKTEDKTKVFFDDCLEIFLQPEDSSVYYGFEINPKGVCLDYRVFIRGDGDSTEGLSLPQELEGAKEFDGGEKIFGYFNDVIGRKILTFDYDWSSHRKCVSEIEDEFWWLDVFIPWEDFGLQEAPKKNTHWRGTINRIDSSVPRGTNHGFLCLLDETELVSFHQPDKFASFSFFPVQK